MNDLERRALHAPFRSRRGRIMAWTIAAAEFAVLLVVALILPGEGVIAFQWYDRLGMILVGAAVAYVVTRFALVRAVPGEGGLVVRNLFVTATVAWSSIESVRFGGGAPWVTLDLSSGESLAVMAVQRADGEPAAEEAGRLATLVELHRGD